LSFASKSPPSLFFLSSNAFTRLSFSLLSLSTSSFRSDISLLRDAAPLSTLPAWDFTDVSLSSAFSFSSTAFIAASTAADWVLIM